MAIDTRAASPMGGPRPTVAGGRWVAWAAAAYVAAWLTGLAIGFATSAPAPTDSPQTIGAYFVAHREAAMVQAYLLDGIAGAALVALAGSLRAALRGPEGDPGTLSSILFGAGIAAGGVSLLQGLFTQVLADRVAATGDGAVIRALFDLNAEGDTYKLLPLGMFIGATALLIIRTGALPRWLGQTGAVLAPLLVVAGWNFALSAPIQDAAYAVLLLALLAWVGAVGVASWRRAG